MWDINKKTEINLFHNVFDFVLFTVQDDASLLTDLQILKNTHKHTTQHQSVYYCVGLLREM